MLITNASRISGNDAFSRGHLRTGGDLPCEVKSKLDTRYPECVARPMLFSVLRFRKNEVSYGAKDDKIKGNRIRGTPLESVKVVKNTELLRTSK